ncbi:interferon-induced very large GTPase 1-like [Antedon mediterranea]|uniref:interferon-induced very large GTPase 1-like n=1 Tax=Antedon mediterranea TaxID=105859 RepID=UPI003AF51C70
MASSSTEYLDKVINHLKLREYYPRKLTRNKVLEFSENVISLEELEENSGKIPWYILQNILMYNYEGRCFDLDDKSQVSPLDALLAVFLCCDNFLRQILIEKLSTCQLAIPLLIPVTDVKDKQWELTLWGMSTIRKKWTTSEGSCEKPMAVHPVPTVSVLRIGRQKKSKSHTINTIINDQQHNIFFNYDCEGGTLEHELSNGLLEMAWYFPTKKKGTFEDALAFINLRGNAPDFKLQTRFLSVISLATIAFVSSDDFNEGNVELIESLYRQHGHVLLVYDKPADNYKKAIEKIENQYSTQGIKLFQQTDRLNKNDVKMKKNIWRFLNDCLSQQREGAVSNRSVEMCIDIAWSMNIHIDTKLPMYSEAKQSVDILLEHLNQNEKKDELPLQTFSKQIGATIKEQHRLTRRGNMHNEMYVENMKEEVKNLRREQHKKYQELSQCKDCTYMTFQKSYTDESEKRNYFLELVKIMTDRYSIWNLQPIRDEFTTKWNEFCEKKEGGNSSKETLAALKQQLDEIEEKLSLKSLGLEHFSREIGQTYEMLLSLNKEALNEFNFDLSVVAAETLLDGYPVELFDGDAGHLPLNWIEAIFDSLRMKIGNKKLFVLSVLGIQSSGKSTLLNTLFGLQFAVSAGRCTKGIFAQLVSFDKGLKETTECDYILVVDTEGLRSIQSTNIHEVHNRDNELATLVIGLGDLTIINIMGENPTDVNDTLQIAMHAFIKMDIVDIKPSCIFVHQNVSNVNDSDLHVQTRNMREKLDKVTQAVAEEENCSGKYKSFSDVINFQENKHVVNVSGLWQGDPPVAPPNPGYSKSILEVKKQVIEFVQKATPKTVHELKKRLSDLWKAILGQNFVFSFKNSLEIQAFNALNTEFVKHARTFRRKAMTYNHNLQLECEKLADEKVKEDGKTVNDSYLKKLDEDISTFKKEMESYFDKERNACQWKGRMDSQREALCTEIKTEHNSAFTSITATKSRRIQIDARIKEHEKEIFKKAKQLADLYRNKDLPPETLKDNFNKNWNKWISDIQFEDDGMDIEQSFQTITEQVFLEHSKPNVLDAWKSDFSRTEIVKGDLDFSQSRGPKQRSYKAHLHDLNIRKNKILEELQTQISKHTKNGINYTQSLGHDMVSSLSKSLEELEVPLGLTKKAIIRLTVCNFMKLLKPDLQKMQTKYKLKNDPKCYMEEQHDRLWKMFKEDCTDLHIHDTRASAISREIKTAIEKSLPNKCKMKVIAHIEGLSRSKMFYSKMSLHAHMLIEIADKGNFISFKDYLRDPVQCIKNFTSEQIKKECLVKRTGLCLLEKTYRAKALEMFTGLKEVINDVCKDGTITMKSWWPTFLENIDNELPLRKNTTFLNEEKTMDLNKLKDKLLIELESVEDSIMNAYEDSLFDSIRDECRDFFTFDLLCCQEVCIFCKALCDFHDKHDNHRAGCHRPQGVSGYHNSKEPRKLVTDVCTTLVMSEDSRFKNADTKDKYVHYQKYSSVNARYKSWKIEPMAGESEMFWKWFMTTYNRELAEYYTAEMADIPDGWKTITLEDVKKDMENIYCL